MATEQWVVGPEYDEQLFHRLGCVLRAFGFKLDTKWDGVGGSQDIRHWEITSPEGVLVVDSETYMGLSIHGPAELVCRIRQEFEATNAF